MKPKKENRKWSQRKRKENGAKERGKKMEPKTEKRKWSQRNRKEN